MMKKIMVMCTAAIMAVIAQGASINWTITNVYAPGSTTDKPDIGSYTAFLFVTSNSTGVDLTTTTLEAVTDILTSGDLTGLSGLAAASKTNSGIGGWSGATGIDGFSSGSLTAFAVVIDSTDLASASNYFLVSDGTEKTATFTSPTGTKTLAFGSQAAVTQGSGWQAAAIPEPTSGLLLLLGAAGLALKRKRA